MFRGILIILLFLVVAGLMIARKIPTLVALPLLAVGICLIAGVPFVQVDDKNTSTGIFAAVIEAGTTRMGSAYIAVIFGAWLGQIMNKTGVTEGIIKKAAELGGDRPLIVTFALALATALLFTTLAGLGSVIMVGTIVLPILISVGVPALSAACIYLMAFATGLTFCMANWQTFINIFALSVDQIKSFEVVMLIGTALATIAIILVEFKRNGLQFAFSAPIEEKAAEGPQKIKGFSGAMAMLSPIIPIILVAFLKVPIVTAFIISIIWITIFTSKSFGKAMNMITKTCYDGISDAAPAVILMIGIGMLYLAVTNAKVKEVLNPFMLAVVPHSVVPYCIFFILLAPLALYRGPLNLFGLGSGIAALVMGLNVLPPLAVMGAFLSVERIQAVGDPTNTQNVWTANFTEVEVNTITKRLLPYLWAVAALGVIYSAIAYF